MSDSQNVAAGRPIAVAAEEGGTHTSAARVLVFNFFGEIMDRGIPLYAKDIAECMRRAGMKVVELQCPRWFRVGPRALRNLLFVLFEQIVAPVVRAATRCKVTVYPYNSAGLIDAVVGRSVLVVHDLLSNRRTNNSLAARYIRVTQLVHGRLRRPVCAASEGTLEVLGRLKPFKHCRLHLWTNPFYSFEAELRSCEQRTRRPLHPGDPVRVLLCSGLGRNKDFGGALKLFLRSRVLKRAELRIVGFGRDAGLARRRVQKLPQHVAQRITVLPRLALKELVEEYLLSDFVWVHSRDEGFGRCVVEAQLSERPVVASDIRAFRRLRGPNVYLYRNERFDAVAAQAIDHPSEGAPCLSTYHAPLEAAVLHVIGSIPERRRRRATVEA